MNKLPFRLFDEASDTGSGQAGADQSVYNGAESVLTESGSTSDRREAPAGGSRAGASGASGGQVSSSEAPSDGAEGAEHAAEGGALQATPSSVNEDERIQKIALAVAQGMRAVQQPAQQPQRQLSPQEINKLLNKFEVNADVLRGLGFSEATPEQIAGFQAFADNIVRNSTTVANLAIQAQLEKMQGTLSPVMSYVQEAQTREMRNSFFSQHKDLEKYEVIVKSVADTINPRNSDGSEKALAVAMKEVADATRKILKESGITLDAAGQEANRSAAPSTAVPKIQQLAGAGRSSSGGQAGKNNNPDADIYSKWQ
jgi:hypothetical protein